jgi:hypothetical protein
MQRFNSSDLEKLEAIFSAKGFTYQSKRTDEREGKPPIVTLELKGSGTMEDINAVLLRSPFVLTGMSSKQQPDGLHVRLQLMQSKVLEDDGWSIPPEFGEHVERFGAYVKNIKTVPEMGE